MVLLITKNASKLNLQSGKSIHPVNYARYHWAFLIGPKIEKGIVPGVRCHVKNPPVGGWVYEEADLGGFQAESGQEPAKARVIDRLSI